MDHINFGLSAFVANLGKGAERRDVSLHPFWPSARGKQRARARQRALKLPQTELRIPLLLLIIFKLLIPSCTSPPMSCLAAATSQSGWLWPSPSTCGPSLWRRCQR